MADNTVGKSTMQDYINAYKENPLSYDATFFKERNFLENGNTLTLLGDSILLKYKTDLDNIVYTKTLSKSEENKYRYNPWLLSYDLYGSVEFWHLLLELNGLYSACEFNLGRIKVYNDSLSTVIDSILALEEEFINNNEEEITDDDILDNIDYEDSDDDNDIEEYDD